MALTSYMTVKGNNQGDIKGDCIQSGHEDEHLIYEIDHEVEIPRDTKTGLPTGQRVHKPFKVTTEVSKGAPQLYQMCASGEQGEVEVKYFRISKEGQQEHFFTVLLEEAIVVEIHHKKFMVMDKQYDQYKDLIRVSFTYSKITWTHEVDGVTGEDDWKAPK